MREPVLHCLDIRILNGILIDSAVDQAVEELAKSSTQHPTSKEFEIVSCHIAAAFLEELNC
jgi:hypothetical protein